MYKNDKPTSEQGCWESLPKVFVEETLIFLTKIYIKSVFGLLPCYLYIYMFTDYSSAKEKNESPNHDTGCGSGNNHRAVSRHCLQRLRTGQSSTRLRPEL